MVAKLDRVATFHDELPPQSGLILHSPGFVKSVDKMNTSISTCRISMDITLGKVLTVGGRLPP